MYKNTFLYFYLYIFSVIYIYIKHIYINTYTRTLTVILCTEGVLASRQPWIFTTHAWGLGPPRARGKGAALLGVIPGISVIA